MTKTHKKMVGLLCLALFTTQPLFVFAADNETREHLEQTVLSEIAKHRDLLNASSGKNVTVFLGTTGSGKSTVINWLGGKQLMANSVNDVVLANPDDPDTMAIGIGAESQTRYPRQMSVCDTVFFDLPGFGDTGTTARHLVNAAFIKQIITQAASIRLVCVAGQDEMTGGRGKLVKDFFDIVQELFPQNQGLLRQSSVFIVTKSDQSDIANLLEFCKLKVESQYNDLIRQWQSSNRFFQMRKPVQGQIDGMYRDAMNAAIQGLAAQKIASMNIGRIHPVETQEKLLRVFTYMMTADLTKHKADPGERLSALKGAMVRFNEHFWPNFRQSVSTKVETKLLKELSEPTFEEALNKFESNSFETLNQLTKKWEIQYDLVLQKNQAVFDKLLYDTVKGYTTKLRQDLGLDSDMSGGDLTSVLQTLEVWLANKATVLEEAKRAILANSAIKAAIDKDKDSLQTVFDDCYKEFTTTHLQKLIDQLCGDVTKKKEMIQIQMQTKKLGAEIGQKQAEIQKLQSDSEEDRRMRKVLEGKIELMRSETESASRKLNDLRSEIEEGKKRLAEAEKKAATAISSQLVPYQGQQQPIIMQMPMPWGGSGGGSFGGCGMGGYQPSFFDMMGFGGGMGGYDGGMSSRSGGMHHASPSGHSGGGRFNYGAIASAYNGGGMTQRQVAQQFGCSQSTVSRAVNSKK